MNLTHAQKVKLILSSKTRPSTHNVSAPKKPSGFSRPTGSVIGGTGKDDIPTLLSGPSKPGEPGEYVLNKGAVLNLGLDFLDHQNLRGLGHLYNNYQLNTPSQNPTVPDTAPRNTQGVAMLQDGSGDTAEPDEITSTPDYSSGYYDWNQGIPDWYQPSFSSRYNPLPSYQAPAAPDTPPENITASAPPMPTQPVDTSTFYPNQQGFSILPGGSVGGPDGRNNFGYFRGGNRPLTTGGAASVVDDLSSWRPPNMSRWQAIQQIVNSGGGTWRPTLGTPNLRTSSPRAQA